MRRGWAVLTVLVVAMLAFVGASAVDPAPAAASCVGPVLAVSGRERLEEARQQYPLVVSRTALVTIVGRYWGDDCNDTGPFDEPTLGDPARDISISFHHGEVEQVVATVDADDCYAFEVAVHLPFGEGDGPATLRATNQVDDEEHVVEREIVVTDAAEGTLVPELMPPIDSDCANLTRTSSGSSSRPAGSGDGTSYALPVAIGAVMVAVVGGLSVVLVRRGQRGDT